MLPWFRKSLSRKAEEKTLRVSRETRRKGHYLSVTVTAFIYRRQLTYC